MKPPVMFFVLDVLANGDFNSLPHRTPISVRRQLLQKLAPFVLAGWPQHRRRWRGGSLMTPTLFSFMLLSSHSSRSLLGQIGLGGVAGVPAGR